MTEKSILIDKIRQLTGWNINYRRFKIFTDTTEWMNIKRGDVIRLGDKDFAINGNMSETRFGIGETPKYWVFSAIDLDDNTEKIIKTEFYEDFTAHIGIFRIKCYRSPDKEGHVLDAMRGDDRFMQGITYRDEKNNNVRVIEYIKGKSLFNYIPGIEKTHYDYFYEDLPGILHKLKYSIKGIVDLHEKGFFHGDIRNDHIIIERGTGKYRWIDFDLKQDVSDFDLWSIGNIISYAVGKGIVSFSSVFKNNKIGEILKNNLKAEDRSAFYEYRVMNLSKIYPYVPQKMTELLKYFTIKPPKYFDDIKQLLELFEETVELEFPLNKEIEQNK